MQFGWCGGLELIPDLEQAGLDYLELQIVPLNLEDDAAFAAAKSAVVGTELPIRAASLLYPRDVRLVGPEIDDARNRRYFSRVVEVLSRAGAGVVVLGSGKAREVPVDWSRQHAEAQLIETLDWSADMLRGSGITLALEPLNRKETNFINSVAEAVTIVKKLNRPEVRALADFYHMDEEHEPLSEAQRLAGSLAHVHVADSGRRNPGTGSYDYAAFFGALKARGYGGLISAECTIEGERVDALTKSVAFMRRAWDAA